MPSRFEKHLHSLVSQKHIDYQSQWTEHVEAVLSAGIHTYDELLQLIENRSIEQHLHYSALRVMMLWNDGAWQLKWWQFRRRWDSDRTISALLKGLVVSAKNEIDWEVAKVLGHLANPRAVDTLVKILLNDPNPNNRECAAWTLGEVRNKRAFDPLLEMMLDTTQPDELRGQCAESLSYLQDKRAVPYLLVMLENDSVRIRWDTIFALGNLGDPRAIPVLQHIAKTDTRQNLYPDNQTLGEQAQEAIEHILDKQHWRQKERQERLTKYAMLSLALLTIYLYWRHGQFSH